jgi:hypothetical protein
MSTYCFGYNGWQRKTENRDKASVAQLLRYHTRNCLLLGRHFIGHSALLDDSTGMQEVQLLCRVQSADTVLK